LQAGVSDSDVHSVRVVDAAGCQTATETPRRAARRYRPFGVVGVVSRSWTAGRAGSGAEDLRHATWPRARAHQVWALNHLSTLVTVPAQVVPAACPIRRPVRDHHGHSRTDRQARRPGFQQVTLVAETSLIRKRSVVQVHARATARCAVAPRPATARTPPLRSVVTRHAANLRRSPAMRCPQTRCIVFLSAAAKIPTQGKRR
jgi:hypothetical protein